MTAPAAQDKMPNYIAETVNFIRTNKRVSFCLFFLTIVSLSLNTLNLRQGLPSEAVQSLVFGGREKIAGLAGPLESSRNSVFEDYSKQGEILLLKYYAPPKKFAEVELDGKKRSVDERKLHSARSALLQSRYPDEQRTLMAISNIRPEKLRFDPGIYQYGGFYFYSCGAALMAGKLAGLLELTSDVKHYFADAADSGMIYLIPKAMGGLMAALSVLLAFFAGRLLGGKATGLIAAAFFSVLPSITFESHCFKPFAFFIPFSLLSLFFSLKTVSGEENLFRKRIFLSSVFAGLSAGALILSGFVVWSTLLSYFFFKKASGKKLFAADLLLIPLGFAASFLATNPYYFTSFHEIRREMSHLTGMLFWSFSPAGMAVYFSSELYKLYGVPLYLLSLSALFFAFIKAEKRLLVLAAPLVLFYLYVSNIAWSWTIAHYAMASVPPSLLLAAGFADSLGKKLKGELLPRSLLALLLLFTFFASVYYHRVIRLNEANLLSAGAWMKENIPAGSSVGAGIYPQFGYKSYPPFAIFDYRVNETAEPEYYIVNDISDDRLRDRAGEEPGFRAKYRLVKEFARPTDFFDKIYGNMLKNNAFIFFEQRFGFYSKRGANDAES
ncbi:MAG: hypothetical protein COT17_01320 [Elusimicrobia bacterium CG08_land_8_20_14_0_20_51_18]|nr:MAG: hypothetical protein COT17_01320 [Elusimicrobia bacterium CG08_land_8_20_14_0_20_51_18]